MIAALHLYRKNIIQQLLKVGDPIINIGGDFNPSMVKPSKSTDFANASENIYAAVICVRKWKPQRKFIFRFLTPKSRVVL